MTSGDDPFEEGQPFLFGAAEQESPTRGKAVSRLTDEISRLEEECSRLRHLTSSLLATLQLPRNRAIFLQFDEWLSDRSQDSIVGDCPNCGRRRSKAEGRW